MTTPRVPSAMELRRKLIQEDDSWEGDMETIRAYARAVLEAAAEVGDRNPLVMGEGIANGIRALKEDL